MRQKLLRSALAVFLLGMASIKATAQGSNYGIITPIESDGVNDFSFYRGETINFHVVYPSFSNELFQGYFYGTWNWGAGSPAGELFHMPGYPNIISPDNLDPGSYSIGLQIGVYENLPHDVCDEDGVCVQVDEPTFVPTWTQNYSFTVLERPLATVSLTSDHDATGIACSGQSVTFTANTVGAGITGTGFPDGPTYDWYKDGSLVVGGTTSSTFTTTVNNGEEVYAVLHPGFKANPADVTSDPLSLSVPDIATPVVDDLTSSRLCYLQPATFSATLSGLDGTTTYQWKRNDTTVSGATNDTWTTSDISKYTTEDITLVVTNTVSGCSVSSEATKTVQAASPLDPNTTYTTASGSTKLCEGDAVTFTSKSAGAAGAVFSWAKDGVTIGGENGSSYTTDQPGAITATVTSAEGCTRATTTPRIINSRPAASVVEQMTGDGAGAAPVSGASFCTGSFAMLSANTNMSGAAYRWKLNGDNKGTAVTQKASVSGDYTVTVTKNSCAATSAPFTVTEKTTDVSITATGNPVFCTPGAIQIEAVSNPEYGYQWYRGSTLLTGETNSSYSANASGSYRVAVSNSGCPQKKSAITTVTATATPTATLSRLSKKPLYWTLRGNPGGAGYTYQWYKDGSMISGATNRDYDASVNGAYAVVVFKGDCSDISDYYPVSSASFAAPGARMIAGVDAEGAIISVYPSPSTGVFNISSEQPVNVVVKDVQGRTVAEVKNAASVDLSNQAPGMYIMSITDAAGKLLQVERVVKQ